MCLSYRQSGLAVTSVSEAAAGCEHLLQQVKHGADLPKPMLSAQEQVLERSVAQQNTLSATHD